MATVALVGGSGNFGYKLLPVLIAADSISKVHTLSRNASDASTAGKMEHFQVDYTDATSLENALKGCNVFINVMGTNGDHLQNKVNLVDAAARVGVKIYIPRCVFPQSLISYCSEFGVDVHVDSEFIRHSMWEGKKAHDTYAESKGLKVISI